MAERLPEAPPPRTTNEPVESTPEIARKNVMLGLALFVVTLVVAAGTVVVALVYLQYD
jgi:hypothetical protein